MSAGGRVRGWRSRFAAAAFAWSVAAAVVWPGAAAGAAPALAAPPSPPPDPNAVSVVESVPALNTWLSAQPGLELTPGAPPAGLAAIDVDDSQVFQTITGFGGAMTDSSAWLIEQELPAAQRTALMADLFGPSGIHLNFVRIPIGASDYTVGGRPYTYDDLPRGGSDPALAHFSIAHDKAYILPALKQVLALDPDAELLASPWSPPAWMKRNHSLSNVKDRGSLLARDYRPWAQYIVKFLQAYAAAGVKISAVTPQNEPGNPTSYPGLDMSLNSIANWTVDDLAPALQQARLPVPIYGFDLGWGSAGLAAQLARGESRQLSGIAWHCYFGSPLVMDALNVVVPGINQIVDECSPGITPISTSEVVISSLRDWASEVALWNLALDPTGGPVQLPNSGCPGCYGLAVVDQTRHIFYPTSAYYELGQASVAIEPGARRIASGTFATYNYLKPGRNFISPNIDDVAVENPDGTRALIAYNNGVLPAAFAVVWHGEYFAYTLPVGATVTFTWNR